MRTAAQIAANKNSELTSSSVLRRVPGFVSPDGGNVAPVAVNDAYSTPRNTTLTSAAPGVLANDTDAESSDTLTAAKVSDPAHGRVTVSASGALSYVPDSGYSGPGQPHGDGPQQD